MVEVIKGKELGNLNLRKENTMLVNKVTNIKKKSKRCLMLCLQSIKKTQNKTFNKPLEKYHMLKYLYKIYTNTYHLVKTIIKKKNNSSSYLKCN